MGTVLNLTVLQFLQWGKITPNSQVVRMKELEQMLTSIFTPVSPLCALITLVPIDLSLLGTFPTPVGATQ